MRFIYVILIGLFVIGGCRGKKSTDSNIFKIDKKLSLIDSLEKKIDPDKTLNLKLAEKLIVAYISFADSFPQHVKAPDVLLKCSDIYYSQRQFQEQSQLLRNIINNYPDYPKADVCYYMLAHILDSEFDVRDEAKKFYKGLVEKYPRSVFFTDSEERLKTIDSLSFQQLIESITSNMDKNPE